jgi:chitinase
MKYIVNLTKMLRSKKPDYILTHSPMSPYVVDSEEFHNAYLFYVDVLEQIKDDVDFINVQFYNNPPEDSDPSAAQAIIGAYNDIVNIMGSASKVTVGLCAVKENTDVCPYCSTDRFSGTQGNESCSDPKRRITDIIQPLSEQHSGTFGGVMFWNTAGDEDGVFSTPIADFFQSQVL